ncbi:MAG: 16S rRNA (guanine(527)-N(7))-methyltransferase RsmG [Firmicutes bacterium]|nr:16S rRNA (guanine(527)-N(7))-methyltransferase RsmG [Bacillota bacterium]
MEEFQEDKERFVGVLREAFRSVGVSLGDREEFLFWRFACELMKANQRANLTAITDHKGIAVKHFADSAAAGKGVAFGPGVRAVDVGSGAGFPGIPLAILYPEATFALLESVRKKLAFLERATRVLGLSNTLLISERAEDAGRREELRGSFDVALSRAVGELRVTAELCLPLVRPGGRWVAMKGPCVERELDEAGRALEVLGAVLAGTFFLELPSGAGGRTLVVVEKLGSTPEKYPRRAGVPERRPL